jgi:hypothetical protein
MSSNKHQWLQRPVTILQGIIFLVVITVAIWISPQITIGTRVDEYEYTNLRTQKEIVDKRVEPIKSDVRQLGDRVSNSEDKIDVQLKDLHITIRKLDRLMYEANPRAMSRLAEDEANLGRMNIQREQERSVIQNSNPLINVSPIINNAVPQRKTP